MSLDFTLFTETERDPEALLTLFGETNQLEVRMENRVGRGLVVSSAAVHELTKQVVSEGYGFTPTVYLYFSIDKAADYDQAVDAIIFGSLSMLDNMAGGAVLNCAYDKVVFARDGELLRRNTESKMWTAARLEKLVLPMIAETLPELE